MWSFNTYMRKAGMPGSAIMGITGHSSREMFDLSDAAAEEDGRRGV